MTKPDVSAKIVEGAVSTLRAYAGLTRTSHLQREAMEATIALLEAQQAEIERLWALELERSRLLTQIEQQGQECERYD